MAAADKSRAGRDRKIKRVPVVWKPTPTDMGIVA